MAISNDVKKQPWKNLEGAELIGGAAGPPAEGPKVEGDEGLDGGGLVVLLPVTLMAIFCPNLQCLS